MKRWSTSLIVRETQIKTTMRCNLTPVRMAIINKPTNKCWWICGKKKIVLHCWWEKQIGADTVENSMHIPQKIKNGTALGHSDSTSGYLSKETQNNNSKEYMHPCAHYSAIYNSQAMEVTHVPISTQVNKKWWALAGWLSWLEHHPVHQKVAGSMPSQDVYRRQPIDVSLSQRCFSLSLSLSLSLSKSINKNGLKDQIFSPETEKNINYT